VTNRRRTWNREARKVLLVWTCLVAGWFLAMLAIDLISQGPGRITTAYLTARPVVFGLGWFGGMLIIRWWARGTTKGPEGPDDGDS
jgi:hypothetical protein